MRGAPPEEGGYTRGEVRTTAADSYQIAIPDRWSLSELSGAI